ncbi:MAG: aldose 1-epimerase [Polaribacter sp.]
MFKVEELKEGNNSFLELMNDDASTKAKISLNEGGRLQGLKFNNIPVIKEVTSFKYENSYASSVLFPFANRIENGAYSFLEKNYKFPCNENGGKNALHGLIFNKEFSVFEKAISTNKCAVTIFYKEEKQSKGFPFTYEIHLTYTLSETVLSLSVDVKNTDTKSFPFVLGWHPYFFCNNLKESTLIFNSDKKIEFNENLITKEIIEYRGYSVFKIEDKQLDDCFILKNNTIEFKTPDYQLEISSTSKENYLQMYTPKDLPLIAIEPMTGVSNSFNNKIGLQVLEPKKSYSLTWSVKMNNH